MKKIVYLAVVAALLVQVVRVVIRVRELQEMKLYETNNVLGALLDFLCTEEEPYLYLEV